jgi:hybrid cluster-associated redox disulfide protein
MALTPTRKMTVAEVLELWPETVPVFQQLKTDCVGCAMAPFDTLSDVAAIYEIELSYMLEALTTAIMATKDGQDDN